MATLSPSVRAEHPAEPPSGRAVAEATTWVTLGGGVRTSSTTTPVFELGGGTQTTFPISSSGDLRVGSAFQFGAGDFDAPWVAVGPVLHWTAAPHDLDMFQWRGDGELILRLFVGGMGGNGVFGNAPAGAIAGGTIAWGYRAPFDLRHSDSCKTGGSNCLRYMTGARFYATTLYAIDGEAGWQVTSGIAFEPIGSIRYIFNLY